MVGLLEKSYLRNSSTARAEDIHDEIQLQKAEQQQTIDQYQKQQADQFFGSSFYQSIKNVHVTLKKTTTYDRVKEKWIQKMTENMTRIEFFEDSDVTEKLNKLKKHEHYQQFD